MDHLKPAKSKSPQKHPNVQEKRAARVFQGTTNAGSGNGRRKNDVRTERFDIECKTTTAKSYSLKRDELRSASNWATLENRDILFLLDFEDTDLRRVDRYVILPEHVAIALVDTQRDYENQCASCRTCDGWHEYDD